MNGRPHEQTPSLGKDKVRKHLLMANIEFVEHFRIFPLKSDSGFDMRYIPDFCLKNVRYKNKRILIGVHTKLRSKDVPKFRAFLDTYERLYHLIVVVSGQQLRDWNWYDDGEQALFHDIWVIDSLEFLIKYLQSLSMQ